MWLTSRISIPDAKLSDSGNYSCSLGRLFTVIVQVQVLTGKNALARILCLLYVFISIFQVNYPLQSNII